MSEALKQKRIAILATDGVEYVELAEPRQALKDAGAATDVIAPKEGKIRSWNHTDWGGDIDVDVAILSADPAHYDALLLPGGVMNPDHLRQDRNAVRFVQAFFAGRKPVAAICHGPWMLVEADAVRGKTLTSWPSLKTDIRNAGGNWVDEEVITDQGLTTSRKPADLPAFNRAIVEQFSQARQRAHHA